MKRPDRLKINRYDLGLKEIKEDLRRMLREHHTLAADDLQEVATKIYSKATALVPVESGELQASIFVDVSYSPRYPGIIVGASALNPRTGYDYALIQEVNEEYNHPNGGQAHFLEQPFREEVEAFFRRRDW